MQKGEEQEPCSHLERQLFVFPLQILYEELGPLNAGGSGVAWAVFRATGSEARI